MNIHPAFVHFPIALLFIYAFIELLPLARWMPNVAWNSVRSVVLYLGTFSALLTVLTGMMAEDVFGEAPGLEAHESMALVLVGLAVGASVISYFWRERPYMRATLMLLAALMLLLLFVVGALGSNLVYGSHVDPIVTFVTTLFGVQ